MIDLSASANKEYKPTLFKVHELLDLHIVGEFESRMGVFTNWLLAHQNVNLTGQRASGKTHIVTEVSKFLPEKNGLFNLSAGSEKSAYYQAEIMKRHSHIMIPELNKLPANNKELLKDWGEGKVSEYKVVVFEAGNRRIATYRMEPKPFIFCLADEQELKIDDQLRSRLTVIRSDISEAQNMAVNIQQAELAMMPSNPKPFNPKDFEDMKQHILTLPPWDETAYRHPSATKFVGCIPNIFTDCRRDFPKYLKNTYGITRFNWKDRLTTEINTLDDNNKLIKKSIMFVAPVDMYYNHIIYGNTLVESSLRCSNIERQFVSILQDAKEPLNRNSIQSKIRVKGLNISAHMITKHMHTLTDLGYVETIKVGSTVATYTVGKLFKDFTFDIDWNEIIKECEANMVKYYPKISEEYYKKYCDNPVAIHPFNGIEIKLKDIVVEKPVKKESIIEKFTDEELNDDEPPDIEVEEIL